MAKAQGINPHVMIMTGLVISNALVALSGSMYSMMMRSANGTFGRGTIVIGLAIVFLGEAIFGKKPSNLPSLALWSGRFSTISLLRLLQIYSISTKTFLISSKHF